MNIEDDDEASVTVHQLYKQFVEMLILPVQIAANDTGERAGTMFRGFEFMPPEKQLVLLRQAFRRPYVAPEIRKWMYTNGITPQKITSLVRAQGVFIEGDRDRCPLIDFNRWAEVNETLRQQGAILPYDVETGYHQPSITNTPYRHQIEDVDGVIESAHEDLGFLRTCAETVTTGLAVFGRYFFSGRPRRMY